MTPPPEGTAVGVADLQEVLEPSVPATAGPQRYRSHLLDHRLRA